MDPEKDFDDYLRSGGSLWDVVPFQKPVRVPGGYPAGLFDTAEGVLEIGRIECDGAREIMRRNGGGMPTLAHVFCRNDPMNGTPGDCLYSMQLREEDAAYTGPAKDFFATMIQLAATLGNARGVAFMSEAWVVQVDESRDDPEDVARMKRGGSIENHPRRIEKLFVDLHTQGFGRHFWTASLTRISPRSIVIPEWKKEAYTLTGGRFDDVLEPLDLTRTESPEARAQYVEELRQKRRRNWQGA